MDIIVDRSLSTLYAHIARMGNRALSIAMSVAAKRVSSLSMTEVRE